MAKKVESCKVGVRCCSHDCWEYVSRRNTNVDITILWECVSFKNIYA